MKWVGGGVEWLLSLIWHAETSKLQPYRKEKDWWFSSFASLPCLPFQINYCLVVLKICLKPHPQVFIIIITVIIRFFSAQLYPFPFPIPSTPSINLTQNNPITNSILLLISLHLPVPCILDIIIIIIIYYLNNNWWQ